MAKTCSQRSAEKQLFEWTTSEAMKTYAADCIFEGEDWEGLKSKYDKILALYVERYPKETSENFSDSFGANLKTMAWIFSKGGYGVRAHRIRAVIRHQRVE